MQNCPSVFGLVKGQEGASQTWQLAPGHITRVWGWFRLQSPASSASIRRGAWAGGFSRSSRKQTVGRILCILCGPLDIINQHICPLPNEGPSFLIPSIPFFPAHNCTVIFFLILVFRNWPLISLRTEDLSPPSFYPQFLAQH